MRGVLSNLIFAKIILYIDFDIKTIVLFICINNEKKFKKNMHKTNVSKLEKVLKTKKYRDAH